ncbi:MAG: hypothetical protein DRO76_01995 [Candidatus Altiarchaeales archaeon]|nr:MAG: hypothetical protein DRO76_01995 [Candidatus Altiarchaeales archaeon]
MKRYLVFILVFVIVLSGCMLLFIYFYPLMRELLNIHIGLFGSSCVGTGCYYSRGGFHTTFPSGAGWYCRGYNIGPICTKDLYLYCRYTKPFEPAEKCVCDTLPHKYFGYCERNQKCYGKYLLYGIECLGYTKDEVCSEINSFLNQKIWNDSIDTTDDIDIIKMTSNMAREYPILRETFKNHPNIRISKFFSVACYECNISPTQPCDYYKCKKESGTIYCSNNRKCYVNCYNRHSSSFPYFMECFNFSKEELCSAFSDILNHGMNTTKYPEIAYYYRSAYYWGYSLHSSTNFFYSYRLNCNCNKIQDYELRDRCYFELAKARGNDSLCDKIKDQGERDRCYKWLAKFKGTPSCEKIQDQDKKDHCYFDFAEAKGNFSLCDKINNQNLKKGCYINLGRIKRSISICDKILDQYYKDWCYSGVVRAKKDPSICDKIQDQHTKNFCYREAAIVKKDPSICDKIQDQRYKDSCYRLVT